MIYKAFSNQGFLFQETLMAAKLLASGVPSNEVQRCILEENLFNVRALESRKTLAKVVLQRLEGIELAHFQGVSLEVSRLMVLLLIARQHRLLSETLLELSVRVKVSNTMTSLGLQRFLLQSREADLTLGSWSDSTFQKSCSNILKYLTEARILLKTKTDFQIVVPSLSAHDRMAIQESFGTWGLRMLFQAENT